MKYWLTFLLITVVGLSTRAEDIVDITSEFRSCWGGSESFTHNADGSITYNSSTWGGLVYGVNGDWSEYSELVFELAEPSPCAVQPLIMYPEGVESDSHYMVAGTTKAFIELPENKRQHVSQVAFQTSQAATIVITRIYLVRAPLQDNGEQKGQLRINELMQSNIDCIMDDLNDFPDSWVELYNSGTTPVNLGRYKLGLKEDASTAWQLPSQIVEAGQFVVVYCDKVGNKLHTDFRLDSGKGPLYLFFDGEVDDFRTNKQIPKQPAPNIALGSKTESDDEWGYQYQPTPGAPNCGVLCTDILGDPVFSEKGRVLTSGTTLELKLSLPAGAPEGTVIRYSLDGKEPIIKSKKYTEPIMISENTTVRAKLFCSGYLSPRSITQSYLFLGHDMTLPVISLVTDNLYWEDSNIGIIANNGNNNRNDWRRPVNFEYFESPNSDSKLNQLCETRVQGGASRDAKLKSLAVYANKRFGTKRLEYEFFPDQRPGVTDFKSLVLRNAGNDFDYLYMRDAVIQRTMAQHCDLDWQAWRPIVIFKNGVYKGMLNIRERSNEDNIYTHYDGLEDLDMIENWNDLKEGDWENFDRFKAFYQEEGHTLAEYEQWMDCTEFLNLMIMNLYFNNQDFPSNNFVLWRPRTEGGRWRFIAKDTDFGLGLYGSSSSYKTLEWLYTPGYDSGRDWGNTEDATILFRNMMANTEICRKFLDLVSIYMGDFLNERGTRAIWDPMLEMIKQEYPYHKKAVNGWINYDQELSNARRWLSERTDQFYQQVTDFYHRGAPVPLTINKETASGSLEGVTVKMNGIQLSQPLFDGKFYNGRAVSLSAEGGQQPVKGWKVVQKNSDGTTEEQIVDGSEYSFAMPYCESLTINALFETSGINNVMSGNDGEMDKKQWFTLDGRQLNACPQRGGIYLHNGRKVIIKD